MRRIRELIALAQEAHPDDDFFSGIDQKWEFIPSYLQAYMAYERALNSIDRESWIILREKAIAHFTDHREGQRKQGFFNQLNDAFAYQYLVRKGYNHVRILRENVRLSSQILSIWMV